MFLQLHSHIGRCRNMNVEKQSKTLSMTGFQWITGEHHSEQLRFLARKTNFWSNTSHSHDAILLLEPLAYSGEISFKSDSTQGWIEKMIHFIEVNSTLCQRDFELQVTKASKGSPEKYWNHDLDSIPNSKTRQQWLFSSSLRNSSRRKKIGKSTWPKDDQAPPWTTKEQTHLVATGFPPFSFICPSHLTAKNATVQAHQNLYCCGESKTWS